MATIKGKGSNTPEDTGTQQASTTSNPPGIFSTVHGGEKRAHGEEVPTSRQIQLIISGTTFRTSNIGSVRAGPDSVQVIASDQRGHLFVRIRRPGGWTSVSTARHS